MDPPFGLAVIGVLVVVALALAWVQAAFFGLPHIAPSPASVEGVLTGPHGFPAGFAGAIFSVCFLVMRAVSRS